MELTALVIMLRLHAGVDLHVVETLRALFDVALLESELHREFRKSIGRLTTDIVLARRSPLLVDDVAVGGEAEGAKH